MIVSELIKLGSVKLRNKNIKSHLIDSEILLSKALRKTREEILIKYDKKVNKYKVKCGSSLESWESSGWINKQDPYGWFQWYTRYCTGRRTGDDERQIDRWLGVAGDNGRFRKWLVTLVKNNNGKYNDETISPKIRQTLQHWGYKLTQTDYNNEIKSRN
mgnify:CR=1 FL=1